MWLPRNTVFQLFLHVFSIGSLVPSADRCLGATWSDKTEGRSYRLRESKPEFHPASNGNMGGRPMNTNPT
jgi:hypothetical protein